MSNSHFTAADWNLVIFWTQWNNSYENWFLRKVYYISVEFWKYENMKIGRHFRCSMFNIIIKCLKKSLFIFMWKSIAVQRGRVHRKYFLTVKFKKSTGIYNLRLIFSSKLSKLWNKHFMKFIHQQQKGKRARNVLFSFQIIYTIDIIFSHS